VITTWNNRYSVPPQFVGAVVDATITSDAIQVRLQGRLIAEYLAHPGRFQVIEDPDHALSFDEGRKLLGAVAEIRRPLSHYAAIVGGEAW